MLWTNSSSGIEGYIEKAELVKITDDYQYAITDHQGNTRILFTSATPAPTSVTANMEAASNAGFQNYTNRVNFELFDHTDFSGTTYTYSQKLTGASGQQVGVAKSFKVYPGDKIKIEAYAKYQSSTGTSNLTGFAAALLSAFGLSSPAGGETGTPSAGVNSWGALVAGGSGESNGSYPKAFVNLVVFDKKYNFLDIGYDGINGGEQIGASPKASHDYMSIEYTAREEGYIYAYVSNENATLVDVYFDDVVITQTKSNLIQGNEYYPFGLQTANSWTRENVTGNNFLANGGTEVNSTTALYDLDYRNFDPILGKMHQVDLMQDKYSSLSPYHFSANNPVTKSDPRGDEYIPCLCWGVGDESRERGGIGPYVIEGGGGGGGVPGRVSIDIGTGQGNKWMFVNEYTERMIRDAMGGDEEAQKYVTKLYGSKPDSEKHGRWVNSNYTQYEYFVEQGVLKRRATLMVTSKFVLNAKASGSSSNSSEALNGVSFALSVADLYRQSYGAVTFGMTLRTAEKNAALYTNYFTTLAQSSQRFVSAVKPFKVAGKVIGGVNLAITGYQVVGDISEGKYYSGGARVAVLGVAAAATLIPVVGWGVTIGIGIADAIWGDEFYNYVEDKFGN